MRIFLFFFLCSFLGFSQSNKANGIILDENTKAPIPYVNISILKSQIGTSSNEDDSFNLEITREDLGKSIKLSSLGFKDSIIKVSNFLKLKVIYLKPKIEQIDEIVIIEKFKEQFLIINPIRKKNIKVGFMTGKNPWKIALFFPYKEKYESTEYLKSVKLHLNHYIFLKSHPSKFRLRLFSVDENGLPGKDLVSESIIVETKKRQKEVEIDISNHNLTFPKEGFYIAFEWLHIPFNEYEMTSSVKGKKGKHRVKKYAPTFSATNEEKGKYKIVIFNSGLWFDVKFFKDSKNRLMIPAISLTLSN